MSTTAAEDPVKEPVDEQDLSEDEFLSRQADQAKAAVSEALQRAKIAFSLKANPAEIVGRHPIIAIVSATVAGFVTAFMTIPTKHEQELRRLAKIYEAKHPKPKPAPAAAELNNGSPGAAKSSIWISILHEAITLLKPILLTVITSSLRPAPDPATPYNDSGSAPKSNV